jgi:hypothetical protein
MQLPGLGGIGLNRSTARLLVLAAFYILFLVLGAAIFSAIEGPEEAQRVRQLRLLRRDFLLDHKCVRGEYCPIGYNAVCVCVRLLGLSVAALCTIDFSFSFHSYSADQNICRYNKT